MDSSGKTILRLRSEKRALELQVKLWREYHAFVNKSMEGAISLAWVHGWRCPKADQAKGAKFREKLGFPDPVSQKQVIEPSHNEAMESQDDE